MEERTFVSTTIWEVALAPAQERHAARAFTCAVSQAATRAILRRSMPIDTRLEPVVARWSSRRSRVARMVNRQNELEDQQKDSRKRTPRSAEKHEEEIRWILQ
jgi:hypothetical protein